MTATGVIARVVAISAVIVALSRGAFAQLNDNCTVSVLNRNVRVNPDGSWVPPNIPANFGPVKARATCVQNGVTTFGESAFFTVPANGAVNLPDIVLGGTTQVPVSLAITPAILSFNAAGQSIQITVTATYPDGSTQNVTASVAGTNYTTSNSALAAVNSEGLVTSIASGTVILQATNDGVAGIVRASVVLNATDTDGDGIPDGVELRTATNPLSAASYDLKKAAASSVVRPVSFILTTSTVFPNASLLLNWKVTLIDGKTTLDLTADARTAYNSSNLFTCNFGGKKGRVFAGSPGTCIVTLRNGSLSVGVPGTVLSFTPASSSTLNIDGGTNDVAVSGGNAYVATSSAGLQIVDVHDRTHPVLVASVSLPGSAMDVAVEDNLCLCRRHKIVGKAAMPGTALRVDYSVGRVFVAAWNDARVYDVAQPQSLRFIGAVRLTRDLDGADDGRPAVTSRILGVAVRNNDVFVGNGHVLHSFRLYPDRRAPSIRLPESAGLLDFGARFP